MLKRSTDRPIIVAHRGSSGAAPENTLAAFSMAIAEGADMIELDVRMTRDFFLVVLHDQEINRTSNGEGKVWEYSLQELRAFDAGIWCGSKFKGERIPTLRQVMELLPPRVDLNIEMKTDGEPRQRLALEEACILAIMEKKLEHRTIVSSFDHAFLKRFHHLFPAIRTGALHLPVQDASHTPSRLAQTLGTSAFICSRSQLTKKMVEDAHAHGIPVACYTVNTREDLDRMIEMHVDAVISDFPGRIRGMLPV
jgi:glycerophosphoryl diester phosphodiesterase